MPDYPPVACEVLLPVFNGYPQVGHCLDSLQRHLPDRCHVHLLDDASTDLRLIAYLDELEGRYSWLRISRFETNLGFVGNVNRGLIQASTDVVLLNSDTLVTEQWLDRLIACADSDPRIGIVCPLSNNATILSVPEMNWDNPIPASMTLDSFAELVANCSETHYPRLPVAVGFCMLIRKKVIDAIGLLHRAFRLGYGEECDFSLRAWEAGFQVVCCDNAFVYHEGERSFAAIPNIEAVRQRNATMLETRWPFYNALIQRWCQRNPLRAVQEGIHTALCEARGDHAPHVLQVIHAYHSLGGTELHSKWIAQGLAENHRVTMLFPDLIDSPYRDFDNQGQHEWLRVLRYLRQPTQDALEPVPRILNNLASLRDQPVEQQFDQLLTAGKIRLVHFQHLLHWGSLALPMIAKSHGIAVVLSLHDYYLFCPVFDLLDQNGHACGKAGADPAAEECRVCIEKNSQGTLKTDQIGAYLEERERLLKQVFAASDAIIVPSTYVRDKFSALHGPAIASKIQVIPHGLPPLRKPHSINKTRQQKPVLRIGIFANLNRRKGADVVLSAARLLAGVQGLEFIHHGGIDTSVEQALHASGIISQGAYHPSDLSKRATQTDLALVPSVYEETFCLTIAELQSLEVPVLAFRVGAVSERIEDGRTGFLVDNITPVALAQRILSLLQQPNSLRHVRQQLKRLTVKPLAENIAEYAALYRRLLNQPPDCRTGAETDNVNTQEDIFTAELIDSLMTHKSALTSDTKNAEHYAYRRWLTQTSRAILADPPNARTFAQQLDILVVDLEQIEDATTRTLASLATAIKLGARTTLIRTSNLNTKPPDFLSLNGPQKDLGCSPQKDLGCISFDRNSLTRQLNQWISESARPWVLILLPGMQLNANAVPAFSAYIDAHPDWQFIYADDDLITENHRRYKPRFKPDFNLDLLRSQNFIGLTAAFQRDSFRVCGGFSRFPETAIYDLCLKFIDQPLNSGSRTCIGHIPQVLFHYGDDSALITQLQSDASSHLKALAAHLERRNLRARAQPTDRSDLWWVDYSPPGRPVFTLLILAYGAGNEVAATIDNIRSVAEKFEVTVLDFKSAGTIWPDLRRKQRDVSIRILNAKAQKGIAFALNHALRACNTENVFITHDGIRLHRQGVIQNLLGLLARPEVALVGPCITNPRSQIIQSYPIAGFWPFGATGQLHAGENLTTGGILNRNLCMQNCVTVSDRFMALRKSAFLRCSGFSQQTFPDAWYMLDFGFRLANAGYLTVWTPHAVVVEEDEGSFHRWRRRTLKQNKVAEEVAHLYDLWLPRLASDPAYNPNLSLRQDGGLPDTLFTRRWDPLTHKGLKILGIPGDRSGSGHYRVIDPLEALEENTQASHLIPTTDGSHAPPSLVELERLGPTTLLLHNSLHDQHLHALALYRQYSDVSLVLSLDDLITELPDWNPFCATNYADIDARLKHALELCDRLIVSTPLLAEAYRELHHEIRVIPNRLRASRWTHLIKDSMRPREMPRKPRIGWAGAPQHEGDLAWLAPVVESLSEVAEWHFFGMCPKMLQPFVTKVSQMVDFKDYPAKLCAIDLDVAVAPLALNDFNRCKSNLKVLEHGILGIPVICSNIEPYRDAPVTLIENNPQSWIKALHERISDLDATRAEGEALRQWVREHWLLEDHLQPWHSALGSIKARHMAS